MQTFLPYPDFHRSATVIDVQRLGKQIIEAGQIYRAITNSEYGWQHHPAVNMWRGYEAALLDYTATSAETWLERRDHNKPHGAWTNLLTDDQVCDILDMVWYPLPPWLGNEAFHLSHQSNLLRKDFDYYSQYFFDVPDNLDYVWPV